MICVICLEILLVVNSSERKKNHSHSRNIKLGLLKFALKVFFKTQLLNRLECGIIMIYISLSAKNCQKPVHSPHSTDYQVLLILHPKYFRNLELRV